jgi:hypothetical protein
MAYNETPVKGNAMLKKLRNFVKDHKLEIALITTAVVVDGALIYFIKKNDKRLLLDLPKAVIENMKESGNAVLYATEVGDILVKVI